MFASATKAKLSKVVPEKGLFINAIIRKILATIEKNQESDNLSVLLY